ncbi:hypothetical protein DL1_08485 [Thioclava dalianensis]|uniref:Uncharacterized protein n=1 Tax=Thioclava dalianensis TaxID=1185766 RepID=A0A074TAV5_9RHOB|nr:hypothetical protein [Thioclava dalianensis]KEP68814.1 hypothetical protein DL1_08485 [Thioclava dalianensis]SFN50179.1 hypothetical protein SAMN05216224_10690 [Thioclava dalianensis]
MEIRCKIERKGGSLVTLEGANYAFTPNDQGDHVADVKNNSHIKRLLSITEGYEVYMPDEAEDQTPAQKPEAPAAPAQKPESVKQEPDPAQISPALNAAPGSEGSDETTDESHDEDEKPTNAADDLETLSDDDLAAKYEQVFDRKPHHNAKRDTLIEKIRAEQAALTEAGISSEE